MLLLKSIFKLLEFTIFFVINKNSIVPKVALIWQENQRYKRYFKDNNIKLTFTIEEKWFIQSMYSQNRKARKYFTLLTPETILYKWKKVIKKYWTHSSNKSKNKGRPPVTKKIKEIIKSLKVDNYLWGRMHDRAIKRSFMTRLQKNT